MSVPNGFMAMRIWPPRVSKWGLVSVLLAPRDSMPKYVTFGYFKCARSEVKL